MKVSYFPFLFGCSLFPLGSSLLQGSATTENPGLTYYYPAPDAPVVDVDADVIVYGGTSGGVVAAVQAVRMGKSVALVVFGRHLGGMTSGGLSATDGVNSSVQGGITREYFDMTGNSSFRPSAAEAAFETLIADPIPGETWDAPIPTYYEQRLDRVEKEGTRILALHMENGSVFRGKAFIDCTYEGDLLARAEVSYTFGRESKDTYGESLAGRRNPETIPGVDPYKIPGDPASGLIYNLVDEPVGSLDDGYDQIQAYNFRMYTSQSSNPSAIQPIFKPQIYDPERFEILYRYHRSGGSTNMQVGNDINNHELFTRAIATDHIGGNRWPDGTGGWIQWADADYDIRELIYQSHVSWQLGMLWYLQHDERYRAMASDPELSSTIQNNIQNLLNKVDQLGFPLGEYPETNGWSHELYVREARRMVSDFVATQAHYNRQAVVPDSVGLANYRSDSHHVRRLLGPNGTALVEGDTGGSTTTPWRIPYRSLVPIKDECENLLVSWAISASSVAFASMRMEPCFMVLSQSAATAACLSIDRQIAVQDLPYDILKKHLWADGQILGDEPTEVTGIVVDNTDITGFSTTGNWIASSSTSGYYGGNYLHDDDLGAGNTATFSPELPKTGEYEVFARWTSHNNRATNVPFEIIHEGGTTELMVNQQANGGEWFSLGTYTFLEGSSAKVMLSNEGGDGYVIADSVQFVSQEAPPVQGVSVFASRPSAKEKTKAPGKFLFVRDEDNVSLALTINFQLSGTAVMGTHFNSIPQQITIPANKRSAVLEIIPVVDTLSQGSRTVILQLTPDSSYTTTISESAEITILDKPYDNWRYEWFSGINSENSQETDLLADYDNDGQSNLIEFIFKSNPRSALSKGFPEMLLNEETGEITFDFEINGDARDFKISPQFTRTLTPDDWQALSTVTKSFDTETTDRSMHAAVELIEAMPVFVRFKIENP